jgi:hypothetical protein
VILSAFLTVLSIEKISIVPYKIKIQLLNKSIGSGGENKKDTLISARRDVANNALKMLNNENVVHTPKEQCKVTVYVQ